MSESLPAELPCPTCGRRVSLATDDPALPFCSARCRWVDLGRWFGGSYRVPVEDEDGLADLFLEDHAAHSDDA